MALTPTEEEPQTGWWVYHITASRPPHPRPAGRRDRHSAGLCAPARLPRLVGRTTASTRPRPHHRRPSRRGRFRKVVIFGAGGPLAAAAAPLLRRRTRSASPTYSRSPTSSPPTNHSRPARRCRSCSTHPRSAGRGHHRLRPGPSRLCRDGCRRQLHRQPPPSRRGLPRQLPRRYNVMRAAVAKASAASCIPARTSPAPATTSATTGLRHQRRRTPAPRPLALRPFQVPRSRGRPHLCRGPRPGGPGAVLRRLHEPCPPPPAVGWGWWADDLLERRRPRRAPSARSAVPAPPARGLQHDHRPAHRKFPNEKAKRLLGGSPATPSTTSGASAPSTALTALGKRTMPARTFRDILARACRRGRTVRATRALGLSY